MIYDPQAEGKEEVFHYQLLQFTVFKELRGKERIGEGKDNTTILK